MAGAQGLENVTWDGATSVLIRFGIVKVPVLKITPPKVDIKVDKIGPVGEMLATKRTPGVAEIGDLALELLTSDYEEFVLPRMPKHAGTEIQFVITCTISHPSVKGSLGRLCDGCRIIGLEGPDLERTEKGLITKLPISVMNLWEKGRDGVWKTLVRKSKMTSADAKALMKF